MPQKRARTAVQSSYTFAQLKNDVQSAHDPKSREKSFHGLAKKYGVSHAVIQRIMLGQEPRRPDIRAALGLPALRLAPVCPRCGQVHVTRRCLSRKPAPKRRNFRRACVAALRLLWGERPR